MQSIQWIVFKFYQFRYLIEQDSMKSSNKIRRMLPKYKSILKSDIFDVMEL